MCRDQDDLVTMEAIRALFGHLPSYNPALLTGATAQTPQEELVSNRMRIRSWSMVASQVCTDRSWSPIACASDPGPWWLLRYAQTGAGLQPHAHQVMVHGGFPGMHRHPAAVLALHSLFTSTTLFSLPTAHRL